MSKPDFFTAVSFGDHPTSWSQWFLEKTDDYFYLGGQKACVISRQELQDDKATLLLDQDASLTAVKVISYFTGFIPLIMLLSKAVLRSQHGFHLIDPKQKLEEGIDVTAATIVKIEKLMQKILEREDDPEITYLNDGPHFAFSLASVPNLVFKIRDQDMSVGYFKGTIDQLFMRTPNGMTEAHFKDLIKAKTVCLYHNLDQLVIPHAKMFKVDGHNLIAHERIDIAPTKRNRERQYQELTSLKKAVKQLATFITKMHFSAVTWKNIPIVNEAPDFQGSRRIALIDLKYMLGAEYGLFGTFHGIHQRGGRGLIRCLPSEELIDTVLDQVRRQGIVNPENEQLIKARRMQELQELHKEQEDIEALLL